MNPLQENDKPIPDPFAADIFAVEGSRKSPLPQNQAVNNSAAADNWSKYLSNYSPSKTNWTKLWQNLPVRFFDDIPGAISDSLSDLLNLSEKSPLEFALLNKREINRPEELSAETTNSWWITVSIEESREEITFEIDNSLAIFLVDNVLGEGSLQKLKIRELTTSETYVLEFIAVNLIFEINQSLKSPIFKFRSLNSQTPEKLNQKNSDELPLLAVTWQIADEWQSNIVRMYANASILESLQTAKNPILGASSKRLKNSAFINSQFDQMPVRLHLGENELTVSELASLEKGDVVLLEKNGVSIVDNNITGQIKLYLGDGNTTFITGRIKSGNQPKDQIAKSESQTTGESNKNIVRSLSTTNEMQVVIEKLSEVGNSDFSERLMTEENKRYSGAELAEDSSGIAVENLALKFRVELAAQPLSLEEASNLRINQVLELGVKPTDAVNLLINDQIVGRGELVTVQDRLGVKITQLLR